MNNQNKIDREKSLARYKHYMNNVRGLSAITQRVYLLIARRFLESLVSQGRWINRSQFTAAAIVDFVRSDSARRTGKGPNTTAAATRSILRFLISQGIVRAGIEAAVPTIRCYKHAALPPCFTEKEIAQLLNATKDDVRKYALLLLISRLGLRIEEAAKLMLEDIDWTNGFIVIQAGKNRCERKLPLAQDLAEALLVYLRKARPKTASRHVFVHVNEPYKSYDGSALGKVVCRILLKSGTKRPSGGAHQFRHTAATKMVNEGASFKTIADLLGHQSLSATAIYAKLDLKNLTKVALAWPGGNS